MTAKAMQDEKRRTADRRVISDTRMVRKARI